MFTTSNLTSSISGWFKDVSDTLQGPNNGDSSAEKDSKDDNAISPSDVPCDDVQQSAEINSPRNEVSTW